LIVIILALLVDLFQKQRPPQSLMGTREAFAVPPIKGAMQWPRLIL